MHADDGYIRVQHPTYRFCIHACASLCSIDRISSLCGLLAELHNPAIAQIITRV